jgi:hypothetical protein
MNSRNTRRAGHITRMKNMKNAYKILVFISNEKRPLDYLGVGVTHKTGFGLENWVFYTLYILNFGLQEI